MENLVETQTVQNEEFSKQSIHVNEALRQLTTMVESLATHNMALETQISLLEQKPLGPFLEEHMDATSNEQQSENPKESDDEFEESDDKFEEREDEFKESSGEKRVEIEENPLTPPTREIVKEVEKEAPIVVPPPYTSLILFPQSFVEANVDSQSKMYV
ncbi:uncharacterized protein LOC131658828 [Vicia villosa]|uniref:uncharacterized protein LOC131658828 n=1 Tax=Vicia villosa TaxID=3911 RepID=UPI00273CE199|nr:uncharacterized protein LOC131658828 [Vicia villosa]